MGVRGRVGHALASYAQRDCDTQEFAGFNLVGAVRIGNVAAARTEGRSGRLSAYADTVAQEVGELFAEGFGGLGVVVVPALLLGLPEVVG